MYVAVLAITCALHVTSGLLLNQVGNENVSVSSEADSESATASRMRYWSVAEAPVPPGDTYLLFEYEPGGLNNIRMGWEYSGVIAKLTGRTLVLPPAAHMYLLDYGPRNKKYLPGKPIPDMGKNQHASSLMKAGQTKTSMEDLVNMKQLHGNLPVLSMEEFEQRTGTSWKDAKMQAARLSGLNAGGVKIDGAAKKAQECDNVPEYKSITSKFLLLAENREGFSCGKWWAQGGPKDNLKKYMSDAEWALLHHGFVWHEDAFAIAAKAVRYLGLFDYVAMHARYGDFVETESQQSPKEILANWNAYLPAGTTLYIATDDPAKFQNQAPSGVRLIMWDDFFTNSTDQLLVQTKDKYDPVRWFKLLGLVEELICTYSKIFVGTARSSFTGHIQRMRIHAGAPSIELINHKDGKTPTPKSPKDFPRVDDDIKLWKDQRRNYTFRPLDLEHGSLFLETAAMEMH